MPIDPNNPNIRISGEGHMADSSHHTVYGYIMQELSGIDYVPDIAAFFDKDGNMRRHPTRPSNDFSRDQFTPFLAYNALVQRLEKIEVYYNRVAARGLFFNEYDVSGNKKPWWNRDILDPQTRSMYWRSQGKRRYLHYVGDSLTLLNILLKNKYKPDSEADENIILHLLVSRLVAPTFISKYAWNYYFRKTKKSWIDKVLGFWDRGGMYYPEMVDLTIGAIRKVDNTL